MKHIAKRCAKIIPEGQLPEYESFVRSHPKGHFMQTAAWAAQKPYWRWAAVAVRDEDGQIIGSCAVLIRQIPFLSWTLVYACRGPVCDPEDIQTLEALMDGVREIAQANHAYAILLDPDVPQENCAFWDAMEDICGVAPVQNDGFEGIQPRFVFRLNLEGKSLDEIFSAFSQKTRYNIRLSERRGVTVKSEGLSACPEFYELMEQTGRRDGFKTRRRPYFERLLQNFGPDARLYMARLDGQAVAGTLAVHCGDKVWYIYGASSNEHRDCMPNALLQWNMIHWAKELSCRLYDFRGVPGDLRPENHLYGLYRFKKGFGGDFTAFGGEIHIVEKPMVERLVQAALKAKETL